MSAVLPLEVTEEQFGDYGEGFFEIYDRTGEWFARTSTADAAHRIVRSVNAIHGIRTLLQQAHAEMSDGHGEPLPTVPEENINSVYWTLSEALSRIEDVKGGAE